jgi:Putative zinc-finger
MPCTQCEDMLTDVLDGTLSPADQAAFDLHILGCPTCSDMLADAQRGAAWLEMLRDPRPEPSPDLFERILAQTSGQVSGLSPVKIGDIAPATSITAKILPFRNRIASVFRPSTPTFFHPRLAMTAAMAFFSIALTLNLTGVRLSAVKLSDLRPTSIKRSFYAANAGVVRYYDNLSVVYQLESSVRDLQRDWDSDQRSAPAPQLKPQPSEDQQPNQQKDPQKDQQKGPGPGSSYRQAPLPEHRFAAFNQPVILQPARPVLIAGLVNHNHAQHTAPQGEIL